MDEHKEYLSKEKHHELVVELESLTHDRRKEIAEMLEAAKALGDLSENAEYHAAREQQAAVEERIMKLESILKNAVIITDKHRVDVASIGSTVILRRGKSKTTETYLIVGSEEADISAGKISNKSPLGEAIFGKKKGDEVVFHAPGGEQTCEIVDIQ